MCRLSQFRVRHIIHTVCALAVLASLFPVDGRLPDKPAGVRTAFELIDKRAQLHSFSVNGLKSVSRS